MHHFIFTMPNDQLIQKINYDFVCNWIIINKFGGQSIKEDYLSN